MEKLEEEDKLNDEISKLQDPEYLAKYAREKYLYSKDDEIIIKIEDQKGLTWKKYIILLEMILD